MPLAPYAVPSDHTRGRRHPEPPHPYRDPFQRDRARIIHARAFRRLEDKTQVFTERANDHFRNRLTHTIEVAQLSRTIAQDSALNLNEAFTETLALAHDIGHPPFGHAGEHALNQLMQEFAASGFDHNLHALRTVEYIEHRYPVFRGLNLTFEVREGIIKHSRDWDAQRYPMLAEYLLDQKPPLEAQLIDFTDEIAYNAADLDDGVEARILTVEQICENIPLFARVYTGACAEYPSTREKVCLLEALKRIFDHFASDLIATTSARLREFNIHSLEDIRRAPQRIAALSPQAEAERAEIKSFLYDALYNAPQLLAHKNHGERVIEDLFRFWMTHPDSLPATYRQMSGLEATTDESIVIDPLPRVVCDYIAGMTDSFCLEQHRNFIR